jgi:pimeloyl-ACP methyl ester carboxylesterase
MNITKNPVVIFEKGSPEKKSIIFVHGFPYDHTMWDDVISGLSADFHCVSYDVRGLGISEPGDGQYTIELFADDLFYVIDKLNLQKPVICGLSMGGYICARAVERNEEKLGGLILCDTKAAADTDEVKLKRAAHVKKINEDGVKKFAAGFVPPCFAREFINAPGDKYSKILGRAMNSNPTGVKGCLIAMAARTDVTGYLPQIKIPAMILCGEKDTMSTPEAMQELAGKINGSKYYTVPGAGHMSPVENPEFVTERIREFLK